MYERDGICPEKVIMATINIEVSIYVLPFQTEVSWKQLLYFSQSLKKVLSIVCLASRNKNGNLQQCIKIEPTNLNKVFSIYKNLVLSNELIIKVELHYVLWKCTAISLRCKSEAFNISERYCSQSLFLFLNSMLSG